MTPEELVLELAKLDHDDQHPAQDCRAHHVCIAGARRLLAALTAAGYAIVKLPEGVEVEHGARLITGHGAFKRLYAIAPPEKDGACYCGPNGGPHWHTEDTP